MGITKLESGFSLLHLKTKSYGQQSQILIKTQRKPQTLANFPPRKLGRWSKSLASLRLTKGHKVLRPPVKLRGKEKDAAFSQTPCTALGLDLTRTHWLAVDMASRSRIILHSFPKSFLLHARTPQ